MHRSALLVCLAGALVMPAAEPEQRWNTEVQPFIQRYCMDCHDADAAKGDIVLDGIKNAADLRAKGQLAKDLERVLADEEMPPRKAKRQPSAEERAAIVAWLRDLQLQAARENPNDPGLVVMPRMTRDEFAWVVRDLYGVTTIAQQQIPGEGGAGEGFTNVGQAHTMTPNQVDAWLAAFRQLLLQARVAPGESILWSNAAGREAATPADLRAQLVTAWGDWHRGQFDRLMTRQKTGLPERTGSGLVAISLEAAWRLHRQGGDPTALAKSIDPDLLPGPMTRWLEILKGPAHANPVVSQLQKRWQALPPPSDPGLRRACQELERWLDQRVESCDWKMDRPAIEKPMKDWKAYRRSIDDGAWPYEIELGTERTVLLLVSDADDGNDGDQITWQDGSVLLTDGSSRPWQEVCTSSTPFTGGTITQQAPSQITLTLPANAKVLRVTASAKQAGPAASMQTMISTAAPADPHWFSRRRVFGKPGGTGVATVRKGLEAAHYLLLDRLVDARWKDASTLVGFTSVVGIPAPDWSLFGIKVPERHENRTPTNPDLSDIRSSATPAELELLKRIGRMLAASTEPERLSLHRFLIAQGFSDAIEGVLPTGAPNPAWSPEIRSAFDRLAEAAIAAERRNEQSFLTAVGEFAAGAWRRPLAEADMAPLLGLYREQRSQGASYEAAMEAALLAVLASPHFLYRAQVSQQKTKPYALAGRELAERLSFTIWGSVPDAQLLALADSGALSTPKTLTAQIDRLVADPRARALAERFAGEWLGFSGFTDYTGPDPERFSQFTPELRRAMHEECVLFFLDLFQSDRPALDIINGRHGFINGPLAAHYGIKGISGDAFRRVELPAERVGAIGMAAILIKTSTPLRTSPVKRGAWVYEHLLSQELPAPPPNVPLISDDERSSDGLDVRAQLEKHRSDPQCMSCHRKIDPFGIALESFDALGRWRTKDLAGQPLITAEVAADGTRLDGPAGLAAWLDQRAQRQLFLRGLARKMLSYCLGRGFHLSDTPLIERIAGDGSDRGPGARAMLSAILISPQFLNRRDETAGAAGKATP